MSRLSASLAGALVLAASLAACTTSSGDPVQDLVRSVQRACAERDTGALLGLADRSYDDALGGAGRLGDDLRQLFAVYGALQLEVDELRQEADWLRGKAVVQGRALRYEGPLAWRLGRSSVGTMLSSGLLTELRGVLYTLRLRRLGFEGNDLDRLEEAISMVYGGGGGDREALLGRLRAELGPLQAVALVAEGVDIAVQGDEAKVEQAVLKVTRVDGRRREQRTRERLTLRLEGTRWRIVDGLG